MRTVTLGDYIEILSGFAFKSSLFNSEARGLPLVRIRDVVPGYSETYSDEDFDEKYLLEDGDLLIGMDGEFNCARWKGGKALLNQRVCRVIASSKNLDDQYLFYFLPRPLKQIEAKSNFVTVKHLSVKQIQAIKIPLPPLEEQRRIAAILDKADGVRRKRKEAIRLTEELLKSTFLEMFGDPVTNPKGWEIKKLEEVTTKITDGVHSRPNYTEQGVPFISVKDITTGELKFDDCKFISEEDHKKYKKRCNPDLGDILYTKVGATYGRPALVNVKSEFSLYVSVCLIKPQRDLIFPEFLKEALATPALKRQADRSIKGIGVPDLHLNMIKDFIVPVPPIYKQKEFLEIASKIQSSKESLTSCSQESENLFNSLLQRAFRGEL